MAVSVILVGCGNMGYAMLKGWLAAGTLSKDDVLVVEPAGQLRDRAAKLGVAAVSDAAQLDPAIAPALIILAVKPQTILDISRAYTGLVTRGAAVVSVAAGTTIASLESVFGSDAAIIRCMPNTPASIGKGMMVLASNANVAAKIEAFVRDLVASSGAVATVEEDDQMDAVTAVSGSGPAYVFHFIECMIDAAIAAGLPKDIARELAIQTVYGAASLARVSEDEPGELRRQVTSPNGTTAAALDVFMTDDRLMVLVGQAVEAARKRSVELRG